MFNTKKISRFVNVFIVCGFIPLQLSLFGDFFISLIK